MHLENEVITADQLPDDPLKMPPPYWRSSGAIFHFEEAVADLHCLLNELMPVHTETEKRLGPYYKQYPQYDPNDEDAMEKFSSIIGDLWVLEHKIRLKAELVCLMSAIQAEDTLNQFCVFNLPQDIAEPIEKLSPPDKLLVANAAVGQQSARSTVAFEAIRKLVRWRNAFAHGHCVDRPTKSLRHNHLIHPAAYPGVPSSVSDAKELANAFIALYDYLRGISSNEYTAGSNENVEEIRSNLAEIDRFAIQGNNINYNITVAERSG